jgi:hypothetical protein
VKAGISPELIGAIAAGVLFLGGGAFAVYWFGFREKPKETANNTPNSNPTPMRPFGFIKIQRYTRSRPVLRIRMRKCRPPANQRSSGRIHFIVASGGS